MNPNVRKVAKKEVLKLLEAGIIYPIYDNKWVSPVHVTPMEEGMIVIKNYKDAYVTTRTITRCRLCIDYRNLNKATRKYIFTLPFINHMLQHLAKHSHLCYLDEHSGFFQILIHSSDQEKITLTCSYGKFSYR